MSQLGRAEPLEADVRLSLARSGYVGDATISAVPETLPKEMEILRDTGAPAHGAGGAAFAQTTGYSNSTAPEDNPCCMDGWLTALGLGWNARVVRAEMPLCLHFGE